MNIETIESRLVDLVRNNGGSLSTSLVKDLYIEKYKNPLPIQGRLTTWLQSEFKKIIVKRDPDPRSNDLKIYLIETPSQPTVPTYKDILSTDRLEEKEYPDANRFRYPIVSITIIESQLEEIVQNNGGSLSTSLVKDLYWKKHKKPLPIPSHYKLTTWLQSEFKKFTVKPDPDPKNNDYMIYLVETSSRPTVVTNKDSLSTDQLEEKEEDSSDPSAEEIVQQIEHALVGGFKPMTVHHDVDCILQCLRHDWAATVELIGVENITEIALDIGRRPLCWVNGKRDFLMKNESCCVTDDDINLFLAHVGGFTDQNRAGFNGTLHRVSANLDNMKNINGLTIRLGRHVDGVTDIIRDLLVDTDSSILILGVPGTGKTTIIREITKILSETKNVWVVDTSNEIGGDGRIPHSCIGLARRMMVPCLNQQANKMIECVQNHTPEVIVIDEIGRKSEVDSAVTTKLRGVRIIASAHGSSIRDIQKNPQLSGLLGGFQNVTLGDEAAKLEEIKNGFFNKLKLQRQADPVFEIVIELQRGNQHEWNIVVDCAKAVDSILDGKKYHVQTRLRDASTGRVFVEKREL